MKYEAWCAFVAHDEMEIIRSYLEAGRPYAGRTDAVIKYLWRDKRWEFLLHPSQETRDTYLWVDAELRLRALEPPPMNCTPMDTQLIERNIRVALADPEVQKRLRRDVEAFYAEWSNPRH